MEDLAAASREAAVGDASPASLELVVDSRAGTGPRVSPHGAPGSVRDANRGVDTADGAAGFTKRSSGGGGAALCLASVTLGCRKNVKNSLRFRSTATVALVE